jgi:Icc protein
VGVGRGDRESARALSAAVDAVLGLSTRPDAVLITGDLVTDPGAREYERVRELLARLTVPVYVLAGNHDDRDALREYFALDGPTGAVGEPFQYATEIGSLRLIACDTTLPGHEDGALGPERLAWLEARLEAAAGTPTVIALHHPPLRTGNRAFDTIGLAEADRIALGDLVARFVDVRRIVGGHFHRTIFDTAGGRGVVACASTHLQAPLEIGEGVIRIFPDTPAFALHAELGDELVSHVQPIG